MLVRNESPRGPMCVRCLIFNLSGPCELLFFLLFYCLLDMSCSECDAMSLYLYVALLVYRFVLFYCVFDSVCELFDETIRNVFGCGCCFVAACNGCV